MSGCVSENLSCLNLSDSHPLQQKDFVLHYFQAIEDLQDNDLLADHSSDHEDSLAEREHLEQENAAGDTTPQSAPSNGEDGLDISPEPSEVPGDLLVNDAEKQLSSSSTSPDMESEKLYVKLKEVSCLHIEVTSYLKLCQ